MSKATYPIKLPAKLKAAARLAKEDGASLNQGIETAVAQKIAVVASAAGYLQQRTERAVPDDPERIMRRVPDAPVDLDDIIPPELAKRLSRLR